MKKILLDWFPWIIALRRRLIACLASHSRTRDSYSQGGEDAVVRSYLEGINPETHIYVDVGGNNPTLLSNTYLFYRHGYRGIVVEPNPAFRSLYERYRSEDIYLPIGCAKEAVLLPFYHSGDGAVMSSFDPARKAGAIKTEYLPCFPLDALLPCLDGRRVFLLSVDVEGLDLEVLQSGVMFLREVDMICVEFGEKQSPIADFLSHQGFSVLQATAHNQIFGRKSL